MNSTKTMPKKSKTNLIELVESKYKKTQTECHVGDVIRIAYYIPEGEKERIQYYEGIIIAIQNKNIRRSFILRRNIQGIGIEQIFFLHSPKILSILKKQSSKVRRAKLYFLRTLRGKSTKLKIN
jgi:large subunit ribosomal protein L19